MLQAEWLPVVMQGSFNEIFVMDEATLRILHANEAACQNLQYAETELMAKSLPDIASLAHQPHFLSFLQAASPAAHSPVCVETELMRRDGSHYPIEFRLHRCESAGTSTLIAIGREIGTQPESMPERGLNKSLIRAIISNTPGLVYQFQRASDNKTSFTYLSDGCLALLGLSADQLRATPDLLLDLILPDDRPSYLKSMADSSHELKSWNWEGRIWVEAWKDIKWINLRATPHLLADGSVQWNGIMSNITQSKLEQFEIKHSRARLAELSAHIERVKELERTQLAREVHDDLGGNLTAIKMALALLASRLPSDNPELSEKAAYVNALVDRTIESAHRIASDLRPSILDFGIVAALEWQTEEFEKQVGISCKFSSNVKEIDMPTDQAAAVFRIFQEALTNIAKHANASCVTVNLAQSRGNINLKIIDNGKGIAAVERLKSQSFGIRGMIERASSLGGKLTLSPTDGGGNTVTIKIPQR